MSRRLRRALAALCGLLVVGGGLHLAWPWVQRALRLPVSRAGCQATLARADLERAVVLGQGFLLAHQQPEGRFDYAYDWQRGALSQDDNAVRQAGATWGLALIARHHRDAALDAALDRALDFFERGATTSASGGRHVVYPGLRRGQSGTQALVLLAHLDRLASRDLDDARRARSLAEADALLRSLLAMRDDDGLFAAAYDHGDGRPLGGRSPYYDGEATLALARAGRVLARPEVLAQAAAAAHAGWATHVVAPRRLDPDPDVTKGIYQWLSMAMWELHAAGVDDAAVFGQRVLELADWMIVEHRTLDRRRNTGYAMEGIAHAADLARRLGDVERQRWYACVYDRAMRRLSAWQIGHPLASDLTAQARLDDPRAIGGVQGAADDPELRIDTVQHQVHAAILGLRFGLVRDAGGT